ncbi:cyclopropane-fatty-acyl-phospholipid synthase [Lepidopterella palustris CBS 459.81]|uniref:Cyclopropane-fatty-acyl-phospholipid synthase n=1 Tax=Lepidopterella palustris CBS 459.81 TaxID=1314670 RepID=A0A8E2JID2_9PEZI|nr:cyclopropane-fatty-acyl-phospholipid synthase [Lepidopterella palustris CBS 459.81]
MTIIDPLFGGVQTLWNAAQAQAWGPVVSLCRSAVLSQLKNISIGRLAVYEDSSKAASVCGTEHDGYPAVVLRVHDEKFWVRLALFADMGFAESYMLKEVSCPDLTQFFKLFILNRSLLSNGSTLASTISSSVTGMARRSNSLKNSQLNVSAHYDISNDMFAAFLSSDMTYSCPIWLPKPSPRCSTESLEEAQMRKLQRFIDNAHVKATDRVLEIGTGWGSFAIQAVKQRGCTVTTITLSPEQKALAEQRIKDAGLSDKITVLLRDYRDLTIPAEGPYDKIISIEMLEAVGKEYLETYFRGIDRLLKKEGGVAVFQCITMPEARYDAYAKSDDFIRRYIFPGGHLPTVTQLVSNIATGTQGSLVVDSIENIGPHYAKALRLWREKFVANFEAKIKPALLREHADMDEYAADVFRRKWEYYFCYSEAGFAAKTLGDVIITVGREGAVEMMEEVPE